MQFDANGCIWLLDTFRCPWMFNFVEVLMEVLMEVFMDHGHPLTCFGYPFWFGYHTLFYVLGHPWTY